MKYTKGNWKVNPPTSIEWGGGERIGACEVECDGAIVAIVPISGVWIDDVTEEHGEANLALIRHAPEMFELLQSIETYCGHCAPEVTKLLNKIRGES